MSGIPKQIEEAAEMAEELHGKMFSQEEAAEEAIPQEENIEQVDENQDVLPPKEEENYEEKYKHLKGKYDAEVPRLHQEIREFKDKVFERLESIQKPKVEEPPAEDERFAKFREEYGEDFVDIIREMSKKEAARLFEESVKPVTEQVQSVEDAQIKVAQSNFMNYLTEATREHGDWQKLWSGEDAKFMEFLNKPDPSGLYTYGQLVQQYNDAWDADKLAKVFNIYFDETKPTPVTPKANPQKDAMVAPARTTQHATPSVEDKKIWTSDMIQEFQRNDRTGKYDAETSKLMWDDLLAAMSENRIR